MMPTRALSRISVALGTAVLSTSLASGPRAVAAPQAVAAAEATGVFAVIPPSGPLGTQIQLTSVTRCPPPSIFGGSVSITMVQFPATSDAVPVLGPFSFPLALDGSWSGSLPANFPESGSVEIRAVCSTAAPVATYAPQSFRQTPAGQGYWLMTTAEIGVPCFCPPPGPPTNVAAFGDARYVGSPADISTSIPLVGMAATPDEGLGYWLVASDGGVFSYGDATFRGSAGGAPLRKPVVGMAPTPTGNGYWLVASDGGIFSYGDATFHGSTGAIPLHEPVVGMAATPSGKGYWLVASDGGIFAFGDATFRGSTGATPLDEPVVGMASSRTGRGYWLVASDGGIFSFGDAPFLGSTGATPLERPVTAMAATSSGLGYWLLASDGGIFTFGDAPFRGSYAGFPAQSGRPNFVAFSPSPDTRPN